MIRFFDIIFSGLAIIILFPFMIPIMIALKLTGEYYIFYGQIRVGRYKKNFTILKFATMLRDSPNLPGGLYTSVKDPRLLPMGKFLRKTKINELPQLLNIFIGQMSLVGYRPTVREHYNAYSEETRNKIACLRPGLTGLGAIFFRNEEELLQNFDNKDYIHQKIIMPYKGILESWYADNHNLLNYFKIIIMTVIVVLKPTSVAWKKFFSNLPPVPEELQADR
jgi:lipopolysaccharide/colanic/teichoic acid biosynthesis glycosyltransferase